MPRTIDQLFRACAAALAARSIERAMDPKFFDVDEIRAAVDASSALLSSVGDELLAIMPPEERALRKSALAGALMRVRVLQINESDSINTDVSTFALNLLLTRGIPAERRAEIVKLLGQLRRSAYSRLRRRAWNPCTPPIWGPERSPATPLVPTC